MATKEQCEDALRGLAVRLDGVDDEMRRKYVLDRTISCRIPDLRTTFTGKLRDGALLDIAETEHADAQIKLTVDSDDLLAVAAGSLPFPKAWLTGRVRVDASVLDLIRLRALL